MEHSGSVQLAGEGRRFTGEAVNISRTGMQVVVNLPDSYESVRSITFALPNSDHAIELPCRIVRSQKESNNGNGGVLGLEFSYQREAQLLLIENYIREIRQSQLSRSGEHGELRQIPRTPCMIRNVATDRDDVQVHSIDNISGDGLLISFTGNLQPADGLWLYFRTPDDSKRISLAGHVVYVIENEFQRGAIAGIRLDDSGYMNQVRVRNFIISCHSVYTLKGLCDHLSQNENNGEFQITDPNKILEIMSKLLKGKIPVNLLLTQSFRIIDLRIDGLCREKRIFEMRNPTKLDPRAFSDSPATYFSFMLEGGSYFFRTERIELADGCVTCRLPLRIFRSEKRSYRRKFMEFAGNLRLLVADPQEGTIAVNADIIDMSRRGFLCQVQVPATILGLLRPGSLVKYEIDGELDLGKEGEVRHLKKISTCNQSIVVQLGIEAGIKRRSFVFRKVSAQAPESAVGPPQHASCEKKYSTRSIPVTYYNADNQDISGLVNTTQLYARTPVVVIPPAFGKKKEALSPFVTTLLYNFALQHKDITVMRYDGINRPGESYNEHPSSQRGYEMLRYKVSQGLDDLIATLDFIQNNPLFEATEVILLTFSMSAIDARKLLSSYDSAKYGIRLWIACMGVACARTTIGNILAGIDVISNCKMGIPTGIHGMLGHILDMDRIARDLIEKKYAYMTDSRQDMAKIGTPVLWIYGRHDKWVSAEEVHDIMSVYSTGHREVIELTTGHNLRTSDEAIQTFKLISNHIYKALFDSRIEPVDPPKDEMLRLISYERERLERIETVESTDYWRSYLIGDNRLSSGYDFYRNLKEFRNFLSREIELLCLEQGNRIADMGCGTGLLLEALLKKYTLDGHGDFKLEIEAVELVPEALEKTRQKCNSIILSNPGHANVNVHYHLADLEPNRFIPVRAFVNDSELDLNFLRNRISGLKNATIDKLLDIESSQLYEIMRGSDLSRPVLEFIHQLPEQSLRDVVVEFNRAVRFVRRALVPEDFIDGRGCGYSDPGKTVDYSRVGADALRFNTLDFGRSGLCFNIPFRDESFDRIAASLLLSYLFNGEYLIPELYRTLRPGGILLVSSMKPDSDLSTIFTNYINDVETSAKGSLEHRDMHTSYTQARAMLNEASGLFELEEDGHFYFYSADELCDLFTQHGLTEVTTHFSLGDPAQAVIVTGRKPIHE